MYQALYRKWRPLTFDDVVGQEHITSTLKRQVQTGRLSHAYLFSGTRGTGKTTCARILARAVNCEHPVDGNPCNECATCRGILDESILDVTELDAASNSRVEDIRALRNEAVFSPAAAKKRVYIIDEAHALMSSPMSFNALLKILEEPPEYVIFILCTTDPQRIPATIISRCQRHSFSRIEPETIAARLNYVAGQEGMTLEPEAAELLARMADGGMRDALSLLDQCAGSEHIGTAEVLSALGLAGSRRTAELMEAVCAGDAARALTVFDRLWQDGKEPAAILDELGGLMRDVLLLQVAPTKGEALLSGIYDRATLRRFAAKRAGSQLMDDMTTIRQADTGGRDPRQAAELCLVKLCAPETGDSLQGLKNRVSRLEAALASATALRAAAPAPQTEEPAPAPEPTPEPVAEPTPEPAEDAPWYTDEDAPPEEPAFDPDIPPAAPSEPEPEPEPEPAAEVNPEPAPAPAAPAASDSDSDSVWKSLQLALNGKMDMGAYAMLMTATQVSATLSGDTLTIHLATPIAKMLLDKPANQTLFQQELDKLLGRKTQVVFSEGGMASAGPDMAKLGALKKFGNIKFE